MDIREPNILFFDIFFKKYIEKYISNNIEIIDSAKETYTFFKIGNFLNKNTIKAIKTGNIKDR